MRAAGDNPAMIIAQGVDRRGMVELALALANGLVAFSGALIAQYQGFADVTMGVGTLVAGMAAVILGETLKPRKWRLGATIAMVAVGAVVFRGLIARRATHRPQSDRPQARDRGLRPRDAGAPEPRLLATPGRTARMIELTSLEKTFEQPGGDVVPALRGVSLTMPAGQFLTVIGSNGSGKSTILNVIAGTYLTDAGTIRIADTDVTRWPEHRRAALWAESFRIRSRGRARR